jgi:hypothetical protein
LLLKLLLRAARGISHLAAPQQMNDDATLVSSLCFNSGPFMSHRSFNFESLGTESSRPSIARPTTSAFRTSISGFMIADEGHMLYEITVEDRRFVDQLLLTSTHAPVWTVRRRFSEFFSFKTAIANAFPVVNTFYFPRKKIFSNGTEPHVAQARRIVLDGWLVQLLSNEEICASELLLEFLQAAPPSQAPRQEHVNFAHSWRTEQGMTEMPHCPGVWWVCFSTHSINAPSTQVDDDALSFHSLGSPKDSSTPPSREAAAPPSSIVLPPPKIAPAIKMTATNGSSEDLQRGMTRSSRSFASLMAAPSHQFVIDSHLILMSDRSSCSGVPFRTLTSHELWHFFSGCSLKVAVLLSGGGLRFVIFGSKINQGNVCQFHAEKGDCIAVVSCS